MDSPGLPSKKAGTDSPLAPTVPDEEYGVDLPMSMSASVILTNLPRDATQALGDVEVLDDKKGRVEMPHCVCLPLFLAEPLHLCPASCTAVKSEVVFWTVLWTQVLYLEI